MGCFVCGKNGNLRVMCRRKSFKPHMQKEKNYFKVCRFLNNLPIFSSVGGKNYSYGDAQRHEGGGGSSFSEQ